MKILLLLLCCILLGWFARGEEQERVVGEENTQTERDASSNQPADEDGGDQDVLYMPEIDRVTDNEMDVNIMEGFDPLADMVLQQRFVLIQSFATRFQPLEGLYSSPSLSSSSSYRSFTSPSSSSSSSDSASSSASSTQTAKTTQDNTASSLSETTQPASIEALLKKRVDDNKNANDSNHNNNNNINININNNDNNNEVRAESDAATSATSAITEEASDVSSLITRLRKQLSPDSLGNGNQAVAPSSTLRSLRQEDYEDGDF